MALKSKSLLPLIESKYSAFTQSEKLIADFFLRNTDEIDLFPMLLCPDLQRNADLMAIGSLLMNIKILL